MNTATASTTDTHAHPTTRGTTAPTRRPQRRASNRQTRPHTPAGPAHESTGTLRMHPKGFAFVTFDAPVTGTDPAGGTHQVPDTFIPPPLARRALTDDTVTVAFTVGTDGRGTATELTVTARPRTRVAGVADQHGRALTPDPMTCSVPLTLTRPVAPGAFVLADLTGDDLTRTPRATPQVVLDDPTSPRALRLIALTRHQLDEAPGAGVLAAADHAASDTARRPADTLPRADLRALTTLTIDGPSSKDLDDALSVLPADPDGGIRVLVHIADVAAAVPAGSVLDTAARAVGTSVYLPGWNRPMLPATLSEQALSLLPGVERDTLTVEMRIDPDGQVTSVDVTAARIVSDARLTYTQVAAVLAGTETAGTETADTGAEAGLDDSILDALAWLRTAAARLGVARAARGGMSARRIEPELAVTLVDGHAAMTASEGDNPAHTLVERLMVAANESVDRWLVERGLPALHRVHATPDADAVADIEAFCDGLGFRVGLGGRITPAALAALETQLTGFGTGDAGAGAVWQVLLGRLGRARYTPQLAPHFGLGSDGYLHFTSPIRRYADLVVHRIIRAYLAGQRPGLPGTDYPAVDELAGLGAHLDACTKAAAHAESDATAAHTIAALTRAGTLRTGRWDAQVIHVGDRNARAVALTTGLTGMLDLPGATLDAVARTARLADGSTVRVGDVVEVTVDTADAVTGRITYRIAGTPPTPGPGGRRRGRRPGRS